MTARDFVLPGTRSRYAPDRDFDIQHYRIAVDIDLATKSITGECSIRLTAMAREREWLTLDAVELEIDGVEHDGKPVDHRYDGERLRVRFDKPLPAGQLATVTVRYRSSPRRGLYFVGPDEHYPDKPVQVWTQGQDEDSRYWFPCIDSPHEKATSEVIATVPASFFALSNGSLLAVSESDGRKSYHWRLDSPHSSYLFTLVAGEFVELRHRWGDVEVCYYSDPRRSADCERTLRRTPEMLEFFSRAFGTPYPYEKYAQIFVADFIFGGMENTTATTLTDTALVDERAALDRDFEGLIAHELAHQWFGNLLTCRDWGEGWLNEGFATYAEYLWKEQAEGRDDADMKLETWGASYRHEDSRRYRRPVATKLYDEPLDVFDHHLYEKGGRILHMLRRLLGDDDFAAALRYYLGKHRMRSVETRDLARAIEESTGRVLDWFFDQWVLAGAGHPQLRISYDWDPARRLAMLSVEQTHEVDARTPLFRLPTTVSLCVNGQIETHPIEISEKHHSFTFLATSEPTMMIFDPGKALLADLEIDKPVELWIEELAHAELAIDRVRAAAALGKSGSKRATRTLVHSLFGDPFWGVQAAAASGLGAIRTDEARDALVTALIELEAPEARRAVARALGEFLFDRTAYEALAQRLERGDDSYFVEAEACLSLGKLRTAGCQEILLSAAQRPSFMDTIRQHAFRGLAAARAVQAVPELIAATAYGQSLFGRRAAMEALAELSRHCDAAQREEIRCLLEERLRDRDFRVCQIAIECLGSVGSPRSRPALQDIVDSTLDGRLRRRSREVLRDIAEEREQSERVAQLQGDVDILRTELRRLRETVEDLKIDARRAPRGPTEVQSKRLRRNGGKKTITYYD